MKYDVHLFPVVRIEMGHIEAGSPAEAIKVAKERWNPDSMTARGGLPPKYADEISHFLVDEVGDEEHQNSQFYEADGKTPLTAKRLVIGVEGGNVASVIVSTSELTEALVMDYDTDRVPLIELREDPDGQKCFCCPFEVLVNPDYVAKCFAAREIFDSDNAVQRIRDILFMDTDDEGEPLLNPDKEWDGADTLEQIAEVIRQTLPPTPVETEPPIIP